MPTKLKGLKIKRIALVDEGANPDAHIRFAKRRDDGEGETIADAITEEQAQGIAKRITDAILKMFRPAAQQQVEKDAHTFNEAEEARNYDVVMDKEVWPAIYMMGDSVRSILYDNDKSESEKEALLKTSVSEFAAALTTYSGSWANGKLANADIAKGTEELEKMRDAIDAAIAKARGADDSQNAALAEPADANPTNEPTDPAQGDDADKGPVTKGANNMIFNTEAMNAEERAQYEDLAKRFGTDDTAPAQNADPVEEPVVDEDIYKGINPAVRAEIESLRKFREDAENREIMEVAKRYTIIGKKPEELAPVLKGLKAAGGTAYADMIAVLDSAVQTVEASGVFSEIGKRGTAGSPDSAWEKIETAAAEIQKAKPTLTRSEAIDEACMQHPDLLEAYEKSRR